MLRLNCLKLRRSALGNLYGQFLLPPLFLDWDELYRREEHNISVEECWDRTKVVFMLHNFLTCFGNIVLLVTCILSGKMSPLYPSIIDFFNLSSLSSPMLEIFLAIYFTAIACAIQAIQIWITLLYYKKFHPWARVLFPPDMSSKSESMANVEKEIKSKSPLRRNGSETDLGRDRLNGLTLMQSKSAPNLTIIKLAETIGPSEEVVAADYESSSLLHRVVSTYSPFESNWLQVPELDLFELKSFS